MAISSCFSLRAREVLVTAPLIIPTSAHGLPAGSQFHARSAKPRLPPPLVAVGTALAGGPPRGSVRAALPHTALISGAWRRSEDPSSHARQSPTSDNGAARPDNEELCSMRDEFLRNVKDLLARRAGGRCSIQSVGSRRAVLAQIQARLPMWAWPLTSQPPHRAACVTTPPCHLRRGRIPETESGFARTAPNLWAMTQASTRPLCSRNGGSAPSMLQVPRWRAGLNSLRRPRLMPQF